MEENVEDAGGLEEIQQQPITINDGMNEKQGLTIEKMNKEEEENQNAAEVIIIESTALPENYNDDHQTITSSINSQWQDATSHEYHTAPLFATIHPQQPHRLEDDLVYKGR